MACYHKIPAFQLADRSVVFQPRAGQNVIREFELACGRCIGCRIARSRGWAIRCVHEAKTHENSVFVTLTYANVGPALSYRDFQLFMKRLRKRFGFVRFFACGEYGDVGLRPHFHCLLFGINFVDRKKCGENLFSSAVLDKIWGHGTCTFGEVTIQSAAYVARYCIKKVNGDMADEHYKRVDLSTGEIIDVPPEMGHMSHKLGLRWFMKYWRDIYIARDAVVVDGKEVAIPPAYDLYLKCLEAFAPDHSMRDEKEFDRYTRSLEFDKDCTPERLISREIVAKARIDLYKRNL